MSAPPKMVTTVNANTKRREVMVVVEHHERQSYSRAVKPAAGRAFKRWVSENIVYGQLVLRDVLYLDETTHEGRCLSVYFYTY